MAILSATVLSNCYYIPQFIASGTKMLFENGSAPTSWTKDISYSNGALRVVNSTVSSSNSDSAFYFTNKLKSNFPVTGTFDSVLSGWQGTNPSFSVLNVGIGTFGPFNTDQTLAAARAHTHDYTNVSPAARISSPTLNLLASSTTATNSEGQSNQHAHGIQATPHTHPFDILNTPTHNHTGSETPHTHTLQSSVAQNFAVYYRDVILATKN